MDTRRRAWANLRSGHALIRRDRAGSSLLLLPSRFLRGEKHPTRNLVVHCVAPTDSFRRQIESPGAPVESTPKVAGFVVFTGRVTAVVASKSTSSRPLVLPAMIGLFGIVS
jgi:hypothetical protein